MRSDFDSMFTLRLRLRAAHEENAALRSGQAYVRMQKCYEQQLREKERQIARLKTEVGKAQASVVTMRKNWTEILEELSEEADRALKAKDKEIERMQEKIWEAQRQRDEVMDKLQAEREAKYQALTELEDEKGKNRKLMAQINRDFENSSKPSSDKPLHKKIANSREKTGRKPGGQPGHKGHKRPQLKPTEKRILLRPPKDILNDPDYYETDEVITKKVVELQLLVKVTEYQAKVYRRRSNGSRYHAPFPDGVINEINYGSSVKAFAFCLNNYLNVPILKTQEFLSDLTDGKIRLSAGFINGLAHEFSAKTEEERANLFSKLLVTKAMHTDASVGRVNGEGKAVIICSDSSNVMYFFRDHKGHQGIEGTPVELFKGTLIHDHDRSFYGYGSDHQECLAHILRYLKDSIQNEPELKWNKKMHSFFQEIIHEHKKAGRRLSEKRIREIEKRYDEILDLAREEYEYEPPSDYYREGYNLQKRLREYKSSHLLFLRDPDIGWTNNEAERGLRKFKRKMKQMVTFRSQQSAEELCDALSIIETGRHAGLSTYQTILNHF